MNLNIQKRSALVTAASKGIGRAIAEALAAEGCSVAICSRDKSELNSTAEDLKKKYDTDVMWAVCDIEKQKDIEQTYKAVLDQFGSIDILVNNCGGPTPGNFLDLDEQKWAAAFEQVLLSAVRFSSLVLPNMVMNEWGRIINITSLTVKQPQTNLLLSNTFRTGLIGFAKSLSNEFAKYNITVNNIAPGFTLTSRLYELAVVRAKASGLSHEEVLVEMAKEVPMNRLGSPEEVAALATFLCSEQAGYITGNTIQVDGGLIKGLF